MISVAFHPEAEREAIESAEWYEKLRLGLGSDFRIETALILERIARQPMLYADEDGVRFAPLTRFPYALIYQVLDYRI